MSAACVSLLFSTKDGTTVFAVDDGESQRAISAAELIAVDLVVHTGPLEVRRLVVEIDCEERELRIATLPAGFHVTCGSFAGSLGPSSPLLSIQCPHGPVAVFARRGLVGNRHELVDFINASEAEIQALADAARAEVDRRAKAGDK